MKTKMTPGRLVLWALAVVVAWFVYALVATLVNAPISATPTWLAWIVWALVGALLLMAALAKAVQIGVRTGVDRD